MYTLNAQNIPKLQKLEQRSFWSPKCQKQKTAKRHKFGPTASTPGQIGEYGGVERDRD